MRGYIRKRGDKYSITIELEKDAITGKRIQQYLTVKGGYKDAEKKLTEILNQIDNGNYVRPGKTAVADFLLRWLDDYGKPNLSPRSYEGYLQIVRHYLIPKLGNLKLVQLRPEHLQRFYSDELKAGLSPQTIRHHHTLLHKALETAIEWGLVTRNIADAVKPPHTHRTEMLTWGEEELNQFLKVAKSTHYYELFYLALFSGMRRSELLALRWKDIDLQLGQVSVSRSIHQLSDSSYVFTEPKSARSRRTISLSPSTTKLLNAYRDNLRMDYAMLGKQVNNDALIFNTFGKPLRPDTVTRAWSILAAKAGVKVIRLHDARHTHASLMLKQGIHPKIVQERLGHSSIAITLDTYSHVAPGLQAEAADRFDEVLVAKV